PPSVDERVALRRLALPADCRMACTARVRGHVTVALARAGAPPSTSVRADATVPERLRSSSRRRVVIIGNGVAGGAGAGPALPRGAPYFLTPLRPPAIWRLHPI